MREKRQQKRRK